MNRQLIIILIIIVAIVVLGFFAALLNGPTSQDGDVANERGGGLFGSLFPFNFGNGGSNVPSGGGLDNPNLDNRPVPMLRMVSDSPTTSGFLFENESGSTTMRFIERGTGHIFEANTENLTLTRISNTTIPGIQEALWVDENSIIIRYLENGAVQNFFVELTAGQTEQNVAGSFLDRWDRAALDQTNETLLTVTETSAGSVVESSDPEGRGARTVFTSALRSWVPLQSSRAFYLQSAPSSGVPGFLYSVSGGSLTKVVGDVPGLQTLVSSSGRYVVYSSGNGDDVELFVYDTATGEVTESVVQTLAHKCAFVAEQPLQLFCGVPNAFPNGEYPNDWLLGRVQLSDWLWVVEPLNGTATLVAVPEDDVRTAIDVWQPMVADDGSYVGFINKNNLSYWSLRLSEEN